MVLHLNKDIIHEIGVYDEELAKIIVNVLAQKASSVHQNLTGSKQLPIRVFTGATICGLV